MNNYQQLPSLLLKLQQMLDLVGSKFQYGKVLMPISLNDKVKKAKILLALKLVSSSYFNSYSDIGYVCKIAFLNSDIAQHIALVIVMAAFMMFMTDLC